MKRAMLIEPVAFYAGLAGLLLLSGVIAVYLAHWFS